MKPKSFFTLLIVAFLAVSCGVDKKYVIEPVVIDIPDSLQTDTVVVNFVNRNTEWLNRLSLNSGKGFSKANKLLPKAAKFDSLSPKMQKKIVRFDLDYAKMWVDANVNYTALTLGAMQIIQTLPAEKITPFGEIYKKLMAYWGVLTHAYPSDLHLDPHAKRVNNPTHETDSLFNEIQVQLDSLRKINAKTLELKNK